MMIPVSGSILHHHQATSSSYAIQMMYTLVQVLSGLYCKFVYVLKKWHIPMMQWHLEIEECI